MEQLGQDGRWHPLSFFSKHLGPDKQRWSTYRKELYGIVQSLRHFLPEFYGRHITIMTDHLPVTKSFKSNTLQSNDPVAQRQLIEIGMFTKDEQYLKAEDNHFADWLSRKTPEALIGEAYKMEKPEKQNYVNEETIDYSKIAALLLYHFKKCTKRRILDGGRREKQYYAVLRFSFLHNNRRSQSRFYFTLGNRGGAKKVVRRS